MYWNVVFVLLIRVWFVVLLVFTSLWEWHHASHSLIKTLTPPIIWGDNRFPLSLGMSFFISPGVYKHKTIESRNDDEDSFTDIYLLVVFVTLDTVCQCEFCAWSHFTVDSNKLIMNCVVCSGICIPIGSRDNNNQDIFITFIWYVGITVTYSCRYFMGIHPCCVGVLIKLVPQLV